jgi:hypothetical protein
MDLATSKSENRQCACAVLERSKESSGKDQRNYLVKINLEAARSMKISVHVGQADSSMPLIGCMISNSITKL